MALKRDIGSSGELLNLHNLQITSTNNIFENAHNKKWIV